MSGCQSRFRSTVADGAFEPEDAGISEFGGKVIERMNALGEAIRAIARHGGVMGIACIAFMVKGSEPVTVDDVIDHVDHVRDLVGIEHVGVGSTPASKATTSRQARSRRELATSVA